MELTSGKLTNTLTGDQTYIEVEDINGNTKRKLAHQRSVFIVEAAETYNVAINSPLAAKALGAFSGLTVAFGQSISAIEAFLSNPERFIEQMAGIIGLIGNLDKLPALIEQMADSYEDKQQLANPYDPDEQQDLYTIFRRHYYGGLLLGEAAKALGGSQATKYVKSSKKLGEFTDNFDNSKLTKAAEAYAKAEKKVTAPGRYVKRRVITKVADGASYGRGATRRILSSAPTVGAMAKVRRFLRQSDIRLGSLSPTEQEELGRLVVRADGGADLDVDIAQLGLIHDLDAQTTTRLQRLKGADISTMTPSSRSRGCWTTVRWTKRTSTLSPISSSIRSSQSGSMKTSLTRRY